MKDLSSIHLEAKGHASGEEGMCAMEAVAWLAGEKHTDAPECACPVISSYVRRLNDTLSFSSRQLLKPYLPLIIGTYDESKSQKRQLALSLHVLQNIAPLFYEQDEDCLTAKTIRSFNSIEEFREFCTPATPFFIRDILSASSIPGETYPVIQLIRSTYDMDLVLPHTLKAIDVMLEIK